MRELWAYLMVLWIGGFPSLWGQDMGGDTTVTAPPNVCYQLVNTDYREYETIIKIKLPPYLSTREVMEQIKLVVQWPGEPPPPKRTTIYVFREDADDDAISGTGARYLPGKGFLWDLKDWHPDSSIFQYVPSKLDQVIYNTLLDSMFARGMFTPEFDSRDFSARKNVARWFNLSVEELDSIYYRVKWWLDLRRLSRQ
ncbi:MAG: hypothetical protein D6681_19445 [Calditrichaeota bacterium]|nr:MAG: hypothetical protein D6681_19445 [Calditrichota bacterium]